MRTGNPALMALGGLCAVGALSCIVLMVCLCWDRPSVRYRQFLYPGGMIQVTRRAPAPLVLHWADLAFVTPVYTWHDDGSGGFGGQEVLSELTAGDRTGASITVYGTYWANRVAAAANRVLAARSAPGPRQ